MREFSISIKKDGSAVLTRSYWNPDKSYKVMNEKPYLFEIGMKVVDPFLSVVTIKEIHKRPSINGNAPQWTLNVEENHNTYVYYEIVGILVRDDIPPYEFESFIQGL